MKLGIIEFMVYLNETSDNLRHKEEKLGKIGTSKMSSECVFGVFGGRFSSRRLSSAQSVYAKSARLDLRIVYYAEVYVM